MDAHTTAVFSEISFTCFGMFCDSSGSVPNDEEQRVTQRARPPSFQGSGNGMIAPMMRMIWLELVLHSQEVLAANELGGRDKLEQEDKVEGREESEEEEGGHVEEGEKSW